MTATTGWFAATFIPENASAARRLFCWSSGAAAEIIECFYTGTAFELIRQHSTTGANITVNYAEVLGTAVTVMGYWTATTLGLSVNGAAFATVGNTNIPVGLGANFDIGTRASISNGSTDLYGAVQWFACGTGTPTAADAAIVATRGTVSPMLDDFSSAASLQMVWSARSTRYVLSSLLGGGDFAGQFMVGPANAIVACFPEYLDASGNWICDTSDAAWSMQVQIRPRFLFGRAAA
jgi:hypothetical protein